MSFGVALCRIYVRLALSFLPKFFACSNLAFIVVVLVTRIIFPAVRDCLLLRSIESRRGELYPDLNVFAQSLTFSFLDGVIEEVNAVAARTSANAFFTAPTTFVQ